MGVDTTRGIYPKENRIHMALLDFIVDANFRSEAVGRVVVFPGDRRHRGYVVKSQAEELKIRSFLRMFYYGEECRAATNLNCCWADCLGGGRLGHLIVIFGWP
jgi:hypothetical protein